MKASIATLTVTLWAGVTGLAAYSYVSTLINRPAAASGYERNWQFQLLMFCIFRLPIYAALLGILLWLEFSIIRRVLTPRR